MRGLTSAGTGWLGLGVVAVLLLPAGVQAAFAPRVFLQETPVGRGRIVAEGGDPDEHHVRDVGALPLASIVVPGWAVRRGEHLVPVAAAWLVQRAGHFAHHLGHRDGPAGIERVGPVLSLAATPVRGRRGDDHRGAGANAPGAVMTATVPVGDVAHVSVGRDVLQRMWILVMAGIPTGVVVAGVGSRLAMLVLRLTSPSSVRGVTSDDGFEIGRFTLAGTYNLLMLGAAVGVIGAVAYRGVSPWLLGPGWLRRFTVAAASGAVVGSMLIHDDGIDFHALKPLWLAITLFVALPALFGVAIAVAVDRVADMRPPDGRRRWILPIVLVVSFPLVIPLVVLVAVGTAGWVLLRRGLGGAGSVPVGAALAVRGAWLAIAMLGLVALVADIRALT